MSVKIEFRRRVGLNFNPYSQSGSKFQPDVKFSASGRIRKFRTNYVIIASFHNLVLSTSEKNGVNIVHRYPSGPLPLDLCLAAADCLAPGRASQEGKGRQGRGRSEETN